MKGMKEISVELMVEHCCVVIAVVCFMKEAMGRKEMQKQRVGGERRQFPGN